MRLSRLLDPNFTPGAVSFRRVGEAGGAGASGLSIDASLLSLLAREAFHDVNFFFRSSHLAHWASILEDPGASENDKFTAAFLLKNASVSAEGILPSCQDTGTATVIALKGEGVRTGGDDEGALSDGIRSAYSAYNLRFSQVEPVSMLEDADTRTNLPAQIDIHAVPVGEPGDGEYRFLFIAKGGGSAMKTVFIQGTPALLNKTALEKRLREKIQAIGTAACPPYYIAVVIGGTSPEQNLQVLKLATAGALDALPTAPPAPFRDPWWEERVLSIARESGLGAQFGGSRLALDARVIRLSRHAASVHMSVGVSCSAHRNALARIGADGAWLEDFDRNPARYLPKALPILGKATGAAPRIDLDRPMSAVHAELTRHPVGTLVLLSGPMVVVRDAAHARLARLLNDGNPLPDWFTGRAVFYGGPANTPPGRVIGSFGPTSAQRMDSYVPSFMAAGASRVMLAKGNRSSKVVGACRKYGGFSLGTVGGAAALIASENITEQKLVAYPELGMEAVRLIEVRDLPAFIVVDDKGDDLYA